MNIKKIIILNLSLLILFNAQIVSQIPLSIGSDLQNENPLSSYVKNSLVQPALQRRAFGYNVYGFIAPLGPFKMFLNSPVITNIAPDPLSANYIAGASFANDGILYGIRNGSNMFVKIDTTSGVITNIGYSGSGTGLAFDWTTNTMFMMTYYSGTSQLCTVNLSNGFLTPVGVSYNGDIEDIACSNAGQLYGIDIYYDKFVSINKTGGNVTVIGSLGFDANYSQGLSWDHLVDSCFYASFNNATQKCEIRNINYMTGNSEVLLSIDAQIDGFAIPGSTGPQIIHSPMPNTENLNGPYLINAVINPQGVPVSALFTKVFWSRNNPVITDSFQMTNVSGNNWSASIPGNGSPAVYRYYIRSADINGIVKYSPITAPVNVNIFNAATDITNPVISHSPIGNIIWINWPEFVTAQVTDNIGIDSVWVKWYKNNTGSGIKHFKLSNTGGSSYSARFNSDTVEVRTYDSIFYRIFAVDNSSNHNKDSTSLYKSKILPYFKTCIGIDTVSVPYPFNSQYQDSRMQMIFLNTELGFAGSIKKISFYVTQGSPTQMNISVRMSTTPYNTLSGFFTTGYPLLYSNGQFVVSDTGWKDITLSTPFYRTSAYNLLIDICFDNYGVSGYSSRVRSSYHPGMTWENHTNNDVGCSLTGGTVQYYRPNICIEYETPTSAENQNAEIKSFSLYQNYPNPFNPSTKIKFSLPRPSEGGEQEVRLVIYDLLGKEISVLVNQQLKPGTYEVEWDGSNFSSGIYFYKLSAGDYTDTKKMVLLK